MMAAPGVRESQRSRAMSRLTSLLVKELIQLFRDRVMLFLILWLYTVEVVICAYALALDVREVPLAVVDQDLSPASRTVVDALTAGGTFRPLLRPIGAGEAAATLQSDRARVAVIVPQGFGSRIARGEEAQVQLILDGSTSNAAAIARGYALRLLGEFQRRWAEDQGAAVAGVSPRLRVWYNPDQTNTSFIVLSMVALAALMVGMIHPAASIVREKEVGTIEQLRVTPIRTYELFLAKTTPTLLIGLLSVFPSLAIVGWFGVPLRGSLTLFLTLTALFLVSAIGLGVLVAAVSRTLQQALLLSFFGLFPVMFLSGTLVPVESMPVPLQWAAEASPLLHYLEITLGIYLKGIGWQELWPHALALAVIGLPLFVLAATIFRRGSP